jgi:hypothetical protein
MRYRFYAAGAVIGVAVVLAVIGTAAFGANPALPYRPVTSDLMNAFIQQRHIKLWLAGKEQNWVFAEYERHNIAGVFARLTEAVPTYEGASNKDLVAAFVTPQLAALDTAIKAQDEKAFVAAYGGLTSGCNGCH